MKGNPIIKRDKLIDFLSKMYLTSPPPSITKPTMFCGHPLIYYGEDSFMVWVGCSYCRRSDLSPSRKRCGRCGAPLYMQNKTEVRGEDVVGEILDITQDTEQYILKGDPYV